MENLGIVKSLFQFNKTNQINQKLLTKKTLVIIPLFIITLNISLYHIQNHFEFIQIQKRYDASGFSHGNARHFFYFQYYKNLFPIAIIGNKEYSKEGAGKLLKEKGHNAIMEYQHWTRLGENVKIWAYYPSAIFKGSSEKPTLKGFNTLVFIITLIVCFIGFYLVKKPLLGILLVLFVNLTPYFHYEVYNRENIFALLACTFLISLSLNIIYIFGKPSKKYLILLLAILSGIIIGFFSEMRAEIKVILVSVILIYTFSKNLTWVYKFIGIILLFLSFTSTKSAIRNHFDRKFEEAKKVVANVGGHVYNGDRIYEHKLWHPIFCGLGDFGKDKGYIWDDVVAYRYAIPVLKERYGMDLQYSGKYHLDQYYDSAKMYYVKTDEIEEYEEVIRDKVLGDIKSDPLWYAGVLIKRAGLVLVNNIPFNFIGLFLAPLIILLIIFKKFNYLTLLISTFPLSATPILIYAHRGTPFNSFFPYIVLLVLVMLIIEFIAIKNANKQINN